MFSQMSGQHFALSRPLDDEVSRVQTKGGYSDVDNFKQIHFQIITCIQTSWITLFCSVITVVTSHFGLDTAKAQWQVLHRPHGKRQRKASPSTLSFTSDSLLHSVFAPSCLLSPWTNNTQTRVSPLDSRVAVNWSRTSLMSARELFCHSKASQHSGAELPSDFVVKEEKSMAV